MMSRSNLRVAVIVLTIITMLIHAYIGVNGLSAGPFMTMLAVLWILNALGYLGILLSFLGYIPFFKGNITGWALIAFTAITIIAWVVMSGVLSGRPAGALALVTKVDELLLIIAVYLHNRV